MTRTTEAHQILGHSKNPEIPDSFWELIEEYRGLLVNQAFSLLGRKEDAEDVVQETFCEVFQNPQTIREARSVGACLRMINKANALDRLRGKRRDSARLDRKQELCPPREAVSGGFGALDLSEGLAKAIEEMPERPRTVVVLRFWEHLSFEEIARRMDLSTSTVHRIFFESTQQIHSQLGSVLNAPSAAQAKR